MNDIGVVNNSQSTQLIYSRNRDTQNKFQLQITSRTTHFVKMATITPNDQLSFGSTLLQQLIPPDHDTITIIEINHHDNTILIDF